MFLTLTQFASVGVFAQGKSFLWSPPFANQCVQIETNGDSSLYLCISVRPFPTKLDKLCLNRYTFVHKLMGGRSHGQQL